MISVADRTRRDINKAFLTAIRDVEFEEVKKLLEHDLDKIDINGYIYNDPSKRPLWEACHDHNARWNKRNARIVALLLEYGADPNHGREVVERNGECYYSIPYSTIWFATEEILSHLLRYGFDPNAIHRLDGWSLLHWHCRNANYAEIELLLRHGANPNQPDESGKSPMSHMLSRHEIHRFNVCLRLLLEYGADPNVIERRWGMTPLFQAIYHATGECRLDCIRLLIRYGADVTIPLLIDCANCIKGDTVLHAAVRLHDVDAVRLMTESQAITKFWWLRNDHGDTVYNLAAKKNASPIIEYLDMKWRQECYAYLRYDWIHKKPCEKKRAMHQPYEIILGCLVSSPPHTLIKEWELKRYHLTQDCFRSLEGGPTSMSIRDSTLLEWKSELEHEYHAKNFFVFHERRFRCY